LKEEENTSIDDLVSCKEIVDADKFKNFKSNTAQLCINPDADYKIIGNMDSETQSKIVM